MYLVQGQAGHADSLSVQELWEENQESTDFFRDVLSQLVHHRFYDDSDAPETVCAYTVSDIDRLKLAIREWFIHLTIDPMARMDRWYRTVIDRTEGE